MIKIDGKTVMFTSFPNGETKIETDSLPPLGNFIHRVSFKYEYDSDLIRLMLIKDHLNNFYGRFAKDAELLIYYMPYSRMDRSEDGSPFTLKSVANFINSLNFSNVIVVEPHSDVTPALLNNVESKFVNIDLLPMVMGKVGFGFEDMIFFPDAGASKRYIGKFKFPYLVGNKVRDFKTGDIKGLEIMGRVPHETNKVIIVDDLSSRGGTFLHSAKKLKELGFKKIYLLVAHCEDTIFEGDVFRSGLIDGVFTTNTIMTKNGIWTNKQYDSRLKVYDIEDLVN